jgi:hypothetical protein
MNKENKKRPITTRQGRQGVGKKDFERDLERLEKVNQMLLKYKGTELYMETCHQAYEILRRVNEMSYE